MKAEERIRCDAFGCTDSHPVEHENLNEPSFNLGHWLGWMYLDLNRPDLAHRPLRFCSADCLMNWVEQATRRSHLSPKRYAIDAILESSGKDELAIRRQIAMFRETL